MKKLLLMSILLLSTSVFADWHKGAIEIVAVGYDGKTISIGQKNFTKIDCTCYPSWPNRYCLDRSRESFKEEYALILSAKARNKSLNININEESCKIIAIYED